MTNAIKYAARLRTDAGRRTRRAGLLAADRRRSRPGHSRQRSSANCSSRSLRLHDGRRRHLQRPGPVAGQADHRQGRRPALVRGPRRRRRAVRDRVAGSQRDGRTGPGGQRGLVPLRCTHCRACAPLQSFRFPQARHWCASRFARAARACDARACRASHRPGAHCLRSFRGPAIALLGAGATARPRTRAGRHRRLRRRPRPDCAARTCPRRCAPPLSTPSLAPVSSHLPACWAAHAADVVADRASQFQRAFGQIDDLVHVSSLEAIADSSSQCPPRVVEAA